MSEIHPLKPDGQSCRILTHLLRGYRLTALQALHLFDCLRLSARIKDLRRRGWAVRTEKLVTKSGKRVAQYSLPGHAR